ncbi:alpha/beta-hydrolase [Dendryphion nanum]|uniref:Carboxylic ester hydrolase n=1 Tax=Dendryphion nanum TaxID=256645 RepID=A0A9P9DBF4_9PLEO|nr:alpha/beta-hydrolase [Dendryphion nanum]
MLYISPVLKTLCIANGLWVFGTHAAVTIANGTIQGKIDTLKNVEKFLGIPYAEPPLGDLRLRQSTPLQKNFDTISATSFGHSCYGPYGSQQPNASEDCLTLNIWRPDGFNSRGGEKLPVLVWFYGGGLSGGYTSSPLFEGTNLVSLSKEINKPIILISVNYRLSAFGFLNGKQMADLGLLNLGMLDQRLALRWIQENIVAFGGDPKKVTLFGQSAGAVSIYSHLISYGGRDDGLYRGAILQSGGAFPLTHPNTTDFQKTFDSLFINTSCSSVRNAGASEQLNCIRKLPIEEFRKNVGTSTGQSIDGNFTPTSIQFAFPAGQYVKVALVVGSNTDEGTTSAPTGMNTLEQLSKPLAAGFFRPLPLSSNMTSTLLSIYPTDPNLGCPYNTGAYRFAPGVLDKQACSIFGDLVQIAPARMIARTLTSNNGGKPIYRYRFNHLASNVSKTSIGRGITTGAEQPYVFSNLVPDSPWDQALAREMTSAWISFAYDLDPNTRNGSALPYWPKYGTNASTIVFNGYGSTIEQDTYRAEGINYIIDNVLKFGAH